MLSDGEHRLGQVSDPADAGEQGQPGAERQAEPQLARQRLVLGRHAGDEDGEEHQVVDPEHDLQRRQRQEDPPRSAGL